ncbi:MAG: universal stress protein [Nocardioides sp.]
MNTTEIPSASIVVAVDGSEHADRAVTWGAKQARLEGLPVVLVHVSETETETASSIVEAAAALARDTCPEVDVQALSLTGEPEDVLVDLSRHARYVVMGSHGHGVLRSALLGSVSAAVAKHAACPVVVCRPTEERFAKTAVVVGADGTPESLPVIELAFRQASLRGIQLNVVHCYDDPRTTGWRHRVIGHQDVQGLRLLLAESVAGMSAQYPDVHVTLRLEHGPVEELLDRGHRPWELVVVGRRPPHSTSRFSDDTIAPAVLERSQSTVMVVPEPSAPEAGEPVALGGHASEETPIGGLS